MFNVKEKQYLANEIEKLQLIINNTDILLTSKYNEHGISSGPEWLTKPIEMLRQKCSCGFKKALKGD